LKFELQRCGKLEKKEYNQVKNLTNVCSQTQMTNALQLIIIITIIIAIDVVVVIILFLFLFFFFCY